MPAYNVLFLCTGNTARSVMAERHPRRWAPAKFKAFSAGSQPKGDVNPLALKVLAELDYPTDGFRSKAWDEFAGRAHPRWISSSPSATTRPARSARSGRDSR